MKVRPQKRVGVLVCLLFATVCSSAGLAQPSSVDWKAYGGAKLAAKNNEDVTCFYDANSVLQQPDRHIRVWTKCLLEKEIAGLDEKSDIGKKAIENAAEKVAHDYVPPYAVIDQNVDFNKSLEITVARMFMFV